MVLGVLLGLVVFALWTLRSCYARVDEGHVAVLVRFGAALRDGHALKVLRPGLHFKQPWDKVLLVSTREQAVDLSADASGQKVMTSDGTELRLETRLRFTPQEGQLEDLLFGMRLPIEHLTGLFSCVLRNELANVRTPAYDSKALATVGSEVALGSYGVIRRDRKQLNERIADFANAKMAQGYGVRFNAIDLTALHPPDELRDGLNAVTQARAEADAARFRMEAECSQRVLAAEQGVHIAKARAEAAAQELRVLGQYLTTLDQQGVLTDYVARRRSEVLADARQVYLKEGVQP